MTRGGWALGVLFLVAGARVAAAQEEQTWFFLGAYLRAGGAKVTGDDATFGGSAGMVMNAIHQLAGRTTRGSLNMALGAGSGGVEGGIDGSFGYGLRLPVGPRHGPFARAGLAFRYAGTGDFKSSFLELPEAELGYHVFGERSLVEIAGRAGSVLTGRFNTDETRSFGDVALRWGGALTLALRPAPFASGENAGYSGVWLDAGFARVKSVNEATARLCVARYMVVCADAMWLHGDGATVVTAGVSLGAGAEYAELLWVNRR